MEKEQEENTNEMEQDAKAIKQNGNETGHVLLYIYLPVIQLAGRGFLVSHSRT